MNPVDEFESLHVRPKPGRTLIVGSRLYGDREDRRKRYADAVGVDMQAGDGVDVVADLETAGCWAWQRFAHIDCHSVFEHSSKPWLMANRLEWLLESEGTIFILAPFVHRLHAYPEDFFRFTMDGVKSLFNRIEWKAEAYVHQTLSNEPKQPPTVKVNDYPYSARCDVALFGVRV